VRNRRGFTLIELMIVVAVILIIAAIAIPGMLNSKIAADEAAAIGALRAINVAELSYQTTYPNKGFAPSLTALGGGENCTPSAEAACLLDPDLSTGTKSGYAFAITAANSTSQVNMSYVAGAIIL